MEEATNVVGGVLPQEQVDWQPVLSGMGPEKVVAVFNPLKADFRVIYARAGTANVTPSPGMAYARERGLGDLGKSAPANYTQHSIILKAGQTVNLPGDLAQKAVQDLTTYILGVRTGHRKTADPVARRDVETEIVITIKDANEFLNQPPPPEDKLQAEITKLNPDKKDVPDPPPGQGTNYTPNGPKSDKTPKES